MFREKILEIFYYHKSAIRNKLKYGVYFPDYESYNMEIYLDKYIITRLKRLIEMHEKYSGCPLIKKETIKRFKFPQEWFQEEFGAYMIPTAVGWTNILTLIVEGLEQEIIVPYDGESQKKYSARQTEYENKRLETLTLLACMYDKLWH